MDDILSSITGDVPQETTGCCRITRCNMFVLWLPGPFYACFGIGFHLSRLSVPVAITYTFPVRSFQLFFCTCRKYKGDLRLCQGFFRRCAGVSSSFMQDN